MYLNNFNNRVAGMYLEVPVRGWDVVWFAEQLPSTHEVPGPCTQEVEAGE